jgi:hypothetical protein
MRDIRFRAWHRGAVEMLYDEVPGDSLKWLAEGQPVEVMQYTGLHDKNGRKIYEGDVVTVAYFNSFTGQVEYRNASFAIRRKSGKYTILSDVPDNTVRVIGNIYESPELLNAPSETAERGGR